MNRSKKFHRIHKTNRKHRVIPPGNVHDRVSYFNSIFAKKFAIIFVLLLITIIGLVVYELYTSQIQQPKTVTIRKQVLVRRSHDIGLISRELTGKSIDVNTGKIILAARIFSVNDSSVYLELDVQTPPPGTYIDYIRYRAGRYVDHGEIQITNNTTKNLLFSWSINKLLADVTNGNWKIATYTNGILSKRVSYEVRNDKVSYVYPEQSITPKDADYTFKNSLASVGQK